MKTSSIKNSLFLKDLFDSSTIEEFVEFSIQKEVRREDSHKFNFNSDYSHGDNSQIVYSPSLIRGKGPLREGYCQICDKWFKMKTSSYWYHMNYKHGISSKGEKFPEPIFREFENKIQGFCKKCDTWISLGNNKKTSMFLWKKHYQKQHSVLNN